MRPTLPSPPLMLVPPITVAAIASISYPEAYVADTEPSFVVIIIPTNAQQKPEIANAIIPYKSVFIPDSLAALSFPPKA